MLSFASASKGRGSVTTAFARSMGALSTSASGQSEGRSWAPRCQIADAPQQQQHVSHDDVRELSPSRAPPTLASI